MSASEAQGAIAPSQYASAIGAAKSSEVKAAPHPDAESMEAIKDLTRRHGKVETNYHGGEWTVRAGIYSTHSSTLRLAVRARMQIEASMVANALEGEANRA